MRPAAPAGRATAYNRGPPGAPLRSAPLQALETAIQRLQRQAPGLDRHRPVGVAPGEAEGDLALLGEAGHERSVAEADEPAAGDRAHRATAVAAVGLWIDQLADVGRGA